MPPKPTKNERDEQVLKLLAENPMELTMSNKGNRSMLFLFMNDTIFNII